MGHKIPTVLNNFNVYGSGHKYVGVASEVALPSFEYMTETIDGAGIGGEIEEAVEGSFGSLEMEIGGKIQSSFEKSIGSVNKKLDSIEKAAKTAAKIATAAFAAVKIGNFVKEAVSVYADFDQAMANTAATAGATGEEYAKLEAAALEMGKKTTKTATEAFKKENF